MRRKASYRASYCVCGEIEAVLVWMLDRFGRSALDLLTKRLVLHVTRLESTIRYM
jgi:hypothetical protein